MTAKTQNSISDDLNEKKDAERRRLERLLDEGLDAPSRAFDEDEFRTRTDRIITGKVTQEKSA